MSANTVGSRHGALGARRRIGFGLHEIIEYAIGGGLIASAFRTSGPIQGEFALIGSLLLAINLCTKTRLGVLKVMSRGLHHLSDWVIIAISAAAPFFGFVRRDWAAIGVTEAVALLLLLIEQSTFYRESSPRRDDVIDASARRHEAATIAPALSANVNHLARRFGFFAGAAKSLIRPRPKPGQRPSPDD